MFKFGVFFLTAEENFLFFWSLIKLLHENLNVKQLLVHSVDLGLLVRSFLFVIFFRLYGLAYIYCLLIFRFWFLLLDRIEQDEMRVIYRIFWFRFRFRFLVIGFVFKLLPEFVQEYHVLSHAVIFWQLIIFDFGEPR